MTNQFKALIALFFISMVLVSCSARYAIQLSDSTHVKKNLALSDSTHKKVVDKVVSHVDSVSEMQRHQEFISNMSGTRMTTTVDSGQLHINTDGSLTVSGTGISVRKSKEKSQKSNTTDVTQFKKTISDLKSQHSVDSSNLKTLTYQLESTSVKKAEVSATYTASSIWAYIIGAPLFILAIGGVIVFVVSLIFFAVIKFLVGLVKKKATV